jgi:hypothetical protein
MVHELPMKQMRIITDHFVNVGGFAEPPRDLLGF